jgi:hypothetical protein
MRLKWSIALFCLIWMTTGWLDDTEGGGGGFTAWRNPFHNAACNLPIHIYSPEDGKTYYTNQILLNFTAENFPETCYYRAGGGWNEIDCIYEDVVTMASGLQTLRVRSERGMCSNEASVSYTVHVTHDFSGYISYWFMLWIFIAGIILLAHGFYRMKNKKG